MRDQSESIKKAEMMPNRLRLPIIFLALALLVGGTGCITASVINSAQNASAQRAREVEQELIREADAKNTDDYLMERAGYYRSGSNRFPRDTAKAVALYTRAAEKSKIPLKRIEAQEILGDMLTAPGSADIAGGMRWLKTAAVNRCVNLSLNYSSSAMKLVAIHEDGRLIDKDPLLADTWTAFIGTKCNNPGYAMNKAKTVALSDPARALRLLLAINNQTESAVLRGQLSPALVTEAERNAASMKIRLVQIEQEAMSDARYAVTK